MEKAILHTRQRVQYLEELYKRAKSPERRRALDLGIRDLQTELKALEVARHTGVTRKGK